MMMPTIFRDSLFDDFMNDFAFPDFSNMEKRLYGCSHRIVSLSRRCNHGAIAVFISYGLPFIRLPTSIRHPVTRLLLMRYAAPQANAETMPDGSGTR